VKASRSVDIFIVEDNPGDIRLVKESLTEIGLLNNLSVAENGIEALKFLRREEGYGNAPSPDIILLDLNLPQKKGLEVLREIKEDPKLKDIPVLVLTSSSGMEDIDESYKLNANCYITKPIDYEQLLKTMRCISEFWFNVVTLPSRR